MFLDEFSTVQSGNKFLSDYDGGIMMTIILETVISGKLKLAAGTYFIC